MLVEELVDADMRGICALRDEETDTVLFWFEDLKERHGDPAAAGPETSFDDAVWQELPSFQELWDPVPELHEMMRDLVLGAGERAEEFLDRAQRMADLEYEIKKGRQAHDTGEASEAGGSGADGSIGSAVAGGGGGAVPGGSEDGDPLGEGGGVGELPHYRPPSQIPSRRRHRKTQGAR
jgi:hypothetical protein